MLHFWKKSSKKDRTSESSQNQNINGIALPVGVLLPTFTDTNLDGPLTNFHHNGYTDTPPSHQSRLSINLSEALQDKLALSYFSQFAELRGYSIPLNLWQDLHELQSNSARGNIRSNGGGDSARVGASGEGVVDDWERSYSVSDISSTRKVCQYLSEDVIQRWRFPEDICTRVLAAVTPESVDVMAVQELLDSVSQILKRELWHDFIRSEFFSKFQVEVLTNGSVTLSDIMYHNAAFAAFTEFLEQEGCQSVLEFWQTATAFQSQLRPDSDPTASQNEAIQIYDKYLSLQATCPLGVDSATRCEVEQRICVEGAAPHSDCLEPALRIAWAYLRYVCLPLFLSSQSYVQLISELMRATRANSSPASSVTDVSVESSRSRYDPDLIWRRRHHNSGLSIGRIDQLGRFETDIEPEPDKKSESRITRVVKKLVNKDEHKAQEEMAWRVAEMIVKDVTNLTMGGQASDEDT